VTPLLDLAALLVDALFLGFVAYGGWLVARGGRFHRDAPEDACHPHVDLSRDILRPPARVVLRAVTCDE
jgi:hypothetical protein